MEGPRRVREARLMEDRLEGRAGPRRRGSSMGAGAMQVVEKSWVAEGPRMAESWRAAGALEHRRGCGAGVCGWGGPGEQAGW